MPNKSRYQLTLDYLFAQLPMFHRIGPAAFKKDLSNTIALCGHLGNPDRRFPSVHIAGTNGKGSVAHMLAAIFTTCGMKTGLYTSPHYRDFRERIKINGELIPKKEIIDFVENHREFSEQIKPSFFEWTVALAFDYFARQKVDIAIIETGLGGRLDSTNVITPLVSVITNIGYDHQQFLGETLPEIAGEKAGIIKPGVPVVIGETHPETEEVFKNKAWQCGSPIFFADQALAATCISKSLSDATYRISNLANGDSTVIELNHPGDYQAKNLVTVLKTVELLRDFTGMSAEEFVACTYTGLANLKSLTNFIGRWEIIGENPTILLDSAHNEAGIRLAMEGLKKIPFQKLHFILGAVNDKSLDKMLPLLPKDALYYFAKANIPRGLDAKTLQNEAAKYDLTGKAYSSVKTAFNAAKKKAVPEDLIFVGGSIFVVAEVI